MRLFKKITKALLISALVAVIAFSGYKLWSMSEVYTQEASVKSSMMSYRPQMPDLASGLAEITATALAGNQEENDDPQPQTGERINRSLAEMRKNVNDDVIGWITVPNTNIDYPIVMSADNDFYLERNIYKRQASAGSIFLDYRCAADFSDFNSIIYGHNMRNRSMFGDIRSFADKSFFESNTYGVLFLQEGTYKLEFFAYMVVRADDAFIYNLSPHRDSFFEYVEKTARNYREPTGEVKVITLSTCAYEFESARMVLLANMSPIA